MKQEFDDSGRHRLVAEDGRTSPWARYRQITILDGKVGHTAFFDKEEGICTPEEFCEKIACRNVE